MSDKSSMLEQLGLLRNLLLRALGVTVFIFACLAFFQDSIYLLISEPLIRFLPDNSSMIATEVTSPFLTPLKLTFYMAIFVAIPYLMFELFAKKKGTKNKYDIGTPNRILFAKITELSVFLCSK